MLTNLKRLGVDRRIKAVILSSLLVLLGAIPAVWAVTGDFDNDGDVDRDDVNLLLAEIRGPGPHDPKFDVNGDGVVNRADARTIVGLCTLPRCEVPVDSTPPEVTITEPANLSLVPASPIRVSGTVDDETSTVKVNGTSVPLNAQTWTATVPLQEGKNTITAVANDPSGNVGTASVQITLDTTPPMVVIESPTEGFSTSSQTIDVAGMINDIVVGTVNSDKARVSVNGIEAEVENRSFLARGVSLIAGNNTITAMGEDEVGNVGAASIQVTRTTATGNRIELVSGQDQRAGIQSELPNPLIVKLVDGAGNPVSNKTVVYRVILGDGKVGVGTSDEAQGVIATTDASGMASTRFRLGSRAGTGIHRVQAKAVGFEDEVIFLESADPNPGDKINVLDGNNQRGVAGQPLPQPLVIAVTDAGANLIANAEVEFEVTQGTGTFENGQTTIRKTTNTDGRASALFTLGPEIGFDIHRVAATLVGTTAFAGFSASGLVAGNPGQTTISGVVLDNQDNPIPGVTIKIDDTNLQAVADSQGQFRIVNAPVGALHLIADGKTATVQGPWPTLAFNLVTVQGVDNSLPSPIYLVKLDTANAKTIGLEDVEYTLPEVPGFKLTVKAGSVTFPDGSRSGQLSVTPVNANKVPMPPPNGMQPQFIVTIQPAGTLFDPPAPLTLPNVDGHAPGAQVEMYSFDHDLEEFVTIGVGTVSQDGSIIESNPGVGVIKAGWHCGSQPGGTGCLHNCDPCVTCEAPECVCNKIDNPACNVPCGEGFCNFCFVCNPSSNTCERDPACTPPPDPGDGTCEQSCGTCLKCENTNCVPDENCMGDGSCEQPCGECEVCRNGECVPDLRCFPEEHPCSDCPAQFACAQCQNDVCSYSGCGEGDPEGDGTCGQSCGACTRCSNGHCLPNDTCEDDGTCSQPCGHCSVCRTGQCVPDGRCDLTEGGDINDPCDATQPCRECLVCGAAGVCVEGPSCSGQCEEGLSCETGDPGECSLGTTQCPDGQDGAPVCQATNQPTEEVCGNELDEDCDGEIDDADVCALEITIDTPSEGEVFPVGGMISLSGTGNPDGATVRVNVGGSIRTATVNDGVWIIPNLQLPSNPSQISITVVILDSNNNTSSDTVQINVVDIVRDKDLWYFGGENPSKFTDGAIEVILSVVGMSISDITTSAFGWRVASGDSLVDFSNGQDNIIVQGSKDVRILSTAASPGPNRGDVSIQLIINGKEIKSHELEVNAPKRLVPINIAAIPGARTDGNNRDRPNSNAPSDERCSGGDGYFSEVLYEIQSNFNQRVQNIEINERFGRQFPIFPDQLFWFKPSEIGAFAQDGIIKDIICIGTLPLRNPQPLPPPPVPAPLSNVIVDQIEQEFRIGSDRVGRGILVQTNLFTRFLDHGRHLNIITP